MTLAVDKCSKLERADILLKYGKACLGDSKFPLAKNDDLGVVDAKVVDTMNEVAAMLERLSTSCDASVFSALVDGEVKSKDVSMFDGKHRTLANVLEVDWERKIGEIDSAESDLLIFSKEIGSYETAMSLTDGAYNGCHHALDKVIEKCSDFQKVYTTKLDKAVGNLREISLPQIDRFLGKYGDIEKCVEKWEMAPMEWIFKEESHSDVKQDIEEFVASFQQCKETDEMLQSFVDKISSISCSVLKEVLEKCQQLSQDFNKKCAAGKTCSVDMLFAHCALVSQDPKEVKGVDQFVKKTFGSKYGIGYLPEKLAEKLEFKPKEEQGPTKKDKKDKKEKKDKNKAEKRPAEDKGNKESKEKKRKSK